MWKLVWNVACLHLCTVSMSPKGSESKFWRGRTSSFVVMVQKNHMRPIGAAHTKSATLNFFMFLRFYGGNGCFWATNGKKMPRGSGLKFWRGRTSSFMVVILKNRMVLVGAAHTKSALFRFSSFFSFLWRNFHFLP